MVALDSAVVAWSVPSMATLTVWFPSGVVPALEYTTPDRLYGNCKVYVRSSLVAFVSLLPAVS